MKIRAFTLCYGNAWERYGEIFANSFAKFWPEQVELVVVADRKLPLPRGRVADLLAVPGVTEFRHRWKNDDRANGRKPPAGAKVDDNGYSWRMDAVKWMPQAMAPLAVLDGMYDGDILVWFDADVETIAPVAMGWVPELLGDGDVACLQRGRVHTEIGFYAVRISARTRSFLRRFANFYATDDVFKLKQWHSAFVFDRALEEDDGIKVTNLNPDGGKGHVWVQSALQELTIHRKGKRKDQK
ncbi:MAG: hypothetical protein ACYCZ0_00120 [Minisyncoccota bacterium]